MTLALKMADIEYDAYEEGFDKGREDGLQAGLLAGLQQGIEQGLEQGAYQNKLETARKLIARSYSPEEIADVSGLTIYQVQSLLVGSEQP
ncbi:MAG: hypothetical protein IKW26_01850 [Treponema sp.]|nr:hypothetical protein [Treponema sp.]